MEPLSPDAIAAIYAGDVVSSFDVYKPERLSKIFQRYGDQGYPDYFMTLRSLGWSKPVALDEYGHHEENRYHVRFRAAGTTGAGTSEAAVDITLHSTSVDANNRFYPRINQQVLFPNEVVGIIRDIDVSTPAAPVLSIVPNVTGASGVIPAVTAGDTLIIFSNAWTEGSGQPKSALSGVVYYENVAQILKETFTATGSEMTRQTWYQMSGMEGAPYYMKGQAEMDYRLALQIDGALLFGQKTTNSALVDEDGVPYKTTEGLIPYMRRKAFNSIIGTGTFAVTAFDSIDTQMERNHAGNYVLSMLGTNRHQAAENSLVTYFSDTNIDYTRKVTNEALFGGNEGLAASVNFKLLTKSERTFCFKRFKSFNHPELYGATGYNFNDFGMMLPLNTRKDAKDTSKQIESIGMRYRSLGGYNRQSEIWQTGGAGPGLKVTEFDKRNTFTRSHVGAHFRGGEQMVLITPS